MSLFIFNTSINQYIRAMQKMDGQSITEDTSNEQATKATTITTSNIISSTAIKGGKEKYLSTLLPDTGMAITNNNNNKDDEEGAYEQSQPWFHKQGDRAYAHKVLKDEERGSFLVRPSSIQGHYVISRVHETGEVRHRLIYRLFPGFSPMQNADEQPVRYASHHLYLF